MSRKRISFRVKKWRVADLGRFLILDMPIYSQQGVDAYLLNENNNKITLDE